MNEKITINRDELKDALREVVGESHTAIAGVQSKHLGELKNDVVELKQGMSEIKATAKTAKAFSGIIKILVGMIVSIVVWVFFNQFEVMDNKITTYQNDTNKRLDNLTTALIEAVSASKKIDASKLQAELGVSKLKVQ